MFENPVANANPAESFLRGYQTSSEASTRNQQLELQRNQIAQEQQKLQQQQAIMELGRTAATTGDPRAISMFSALNPEGGKGLREAHKFFTEEAGGLLQSIQEAKITDRPATYEMNLARLKKIPGFDASEYPDVYDPSMVNPLLQKDILLTRDRSKGYDFQETDQGLMRKDLSTGQLSPTGFGVYRKPPSSVVNIDNRQESEYNKAVGKGEGEAVVKKLDEVRNAGEQAIQTKDFLNVQKEALANLKSTGPLSGLQSFFGNLAGQVVDDTQRTSLSKAIQNAKNIDEITAAGRKIAIPLAKQLGYNPTDADFKAILATIADVGKGKKTNEDLINLWDSLADKAIAKAQKADEITSENRYKSAHKELRDFDLNYKAPAKPKPEKPSAPANSGAIIRTQKPLDQMTLEELRNLKGGR